MSNLAIGIALGSAMNSASNYSGKVGDMDIPVPVAWYLLITLTICVVGVVIQAYRGKIEFLDNHWVILILGPIFGIIIWALLTILVGLFALLISAVIG